MYHSPASEVRPHAANLQRIDTSKRSFPPFAGVRMDADTHCRDSPRRLCSCRVGTAHQRPSLFTALEEQLGLRLVPQRIRLEVFVIDSIERPTPN